MSAPTVAVAILACNHARYIQRCLDSAIEQSGDVDLHILVGDDASDDGTSEILAKIAAAHPSLVTHVRHPTRIGGSKNYRFVLTRSHGHFIAYLDGDDYWLPTKLRRQVAFMEAHPEVAATYTNALTIRDDGTTLGVFNDVGDARFDLGMLLRRGNFLNASSMVFRESARQALLDIPEDYLDYQGHLKLARSGYLAQIGEPLAVYRVNSTGSMVARANGRVRELYWQAIQSVPRELVSDAEYARGISDFLRRVAFRAVRTRQWHLLHEWAPRVFKASPFGKTRTSLLTLASGMRLLGKDLVGRLRRGNDGRRLRVLYRR